MDKYIEQFLGFSGFGPPTQQRPVPDALIQAYRGRLPDVLLGYWRDFGWCAFGEGLLWMVNPSDWAETLQTWIGETPFVEEDTYHVILRTAFGGLVLWGERTGQSLEVFPYHGMVVPGFSPEKFAERGPELSLQLAFAAFDKEEFDVVDDSERGLFDQALKELGPLNENSIYGFVPALSLGGTESVDHLQIVNAHSHLDLLAQTTEITVLRDILSDGRNAGLL